MKKILVFTSLLLWAIPLVCFAATVNLSVPNYLPINTPCSDYSPEVKVNYSGLENQRYTLKIWLLESPRLDPSPDCASGCSAGFCPRVVEIDNTGGGSPSGYVSIVKDFDVYNYTEFDWIARLYNESGSQVAWAEQYVPGTYNRAPKLNNVGDKNGYVGNLLEFYVSGSDSDGDDLSYSAHGLPSGASFDSGTGKFTWTPFEAGSYTDLMFRVADNGEGNLYDDEVITIIINECSIPSTPFNPAPPVGATEVSITYTLDWANVEGSDSYNVYLDKTAPPGFVGSTISSSFTPGTLEYDTTYYWEVESVNTCGAITGSVWNFTTESQPSPNNPPNIPNSPSPDDGSASVSIIPTLSWSGDDPDGNIVTYDVYFGTNSNPPLVSSSQNPTIYSPDALEYSTKYYWKIVSRDSNGAETIGPVWSFTTVNIDTSVDLAYQHLYEIMDKHHDSFDVYSDQDAGGNHGYPSGWMGDISGLEMDTAWTADCHSGTTCIKFTWITPVDEPWVGVMWQEPEGNWGNVQNGGYNLTGITKLRLWARGEEGGEPVRFIVGGVQGEYPDSIQPQIRTEVISLTNQWKEYTIDLTGKDLSNVIGLFGWVTAIDPVFYLDDIRYDKSQPNELRFLGSYETLAVTDPDRYIKNASFVYDNALALLSFLARGNNDDLRRAGILANAFVYAMNNDRYYTDGRLRNAYMSGDLIDHSTGKVRIPGWWDPIDEKWHEDKFHVSTHTGNMAWVMIALLNYYKNVGGDQYLEAAINLGEWIERETRDTRGSGGYTGGYEGWEPDTIKLRWKSTEHNTDVYVAFMLLYETTGNETWKEKALHAKGFVEAMWSKDGEHFWTGTLDDGVTINESNIPVDIQAWALMAMGGYCSALSWAENNAYTEHDMFKGFDFNNDRDGIWFEGTAQMAVAYQITGEVDKSDKFIDELRKAQTSASNANGKGIVAACHDGVTTGFDWKYYSRLHLGATAWYIFAERQFNPYWGTSTLTAPGSLSPTVPSNPSPANGASWTSLETGLDWADTSGAVSYDVHFGTNPSPPFVANVTSSTYNPGSLNPNTSYYWKVTAKNICGNTEGPAWSFTTVNSGGNNISLTAGWNLISLPLQPSDNAIESVLSSISGQYESVWVFMNGNWKVYDPANPGFSDLTSMEAGWGYWIKMTEAASFSVSGTTPSDTIPLVSGWNLVGYNSTNSQDIADALASIEGKYVSVWAFMDGGWKVYDPASQGFSDLLTMEPNYGYWINTTQACNWSLP